MIALGLGSLFCCWVLYAARLVARTRPVLGPVGSGVLIRWGVVGIWQRRDARMALFGPGALFELIFPLWLVVRSFTPGIDEGGRR